MNILDLVAALNRILGTAVSPVHGPPRAGDVRFSRADITRIRTAIGYEPRVAFEEGLRWTVEWYRSQGGC
jgi:UDP-glucose 4-epimerase